MIDKLKELRKLVIAGRFSEALRLLDSLIAEQEPPTLGVSVNDRVTTEDKFGG